MANSVHISVARAMMERPDAVDLTVWKQDGSVVEYPACICLSYDFRAGNRRIKLSRSNLIRTVRDVCIHKINGMEVFF